MLLSKLSEKIIWINCQFPTESRNISTHLSTILNRLVCNKTVIISEMLTQSNHKFNNLDIYFKNWKHSWFTHYVDTKVILSLSYSVFVKLPLCLRENWHYNHSATTTPQKKGQTDRRKDRQTYKQTDSDKHIKR